MLGSVRFAVIGLLAALVLSGCAPARGTAPSASQPVQTQQPATATSQQSPATATPDSTSTPVPTPAPTATPVPTAAPPARLVIPSIGVDASVEQVGLTSDGAMDAPSNPDEVAWYKNGPKPGDKGNALIDGHVDWGGKVRVFYPLKQLKKGDEVSVEAKDGHRYDFVVQWARWYDANADPGPEIFKSSDSSELTLITCGGDFDHATRSYLSRLVVRAQLR